MKIALCLSGFLRNYRHTIRRMQSFLLDTWKPDVFFHGYPNMEGMHKSKEGIETLYNPKSYRLMDYTDALCEKILEPAQGETFSYRYGNFSNASLFSIYRNVYLANELRKQYEQEQGFTYDVVIRARTDVFWARPVLEGELKAGAAGFLISPGTWDFKAVNGFGMTDAFAITSPSQMDIYASLYNNILTYYRQGCVFHHESMVGWHARQTGLHYVRISCEPHFYFEYPEEFNNMPDAARHRNKY